MNFKSNNKIITSEFDVMPSNVGLCDGLTVFLEFHVLNKMSKNKITIGNSSDVNILLQLPAKRQ